MSRLPWSDPVAVGLLAGYVLDGALGDPRRGHPVAHYGSWAAAVERRLHADSRATGVVAEATVLAPLVALGVAAGRLPPLPRAIATTAATWAALGGTSLGREAAAVHALLDSDDLAGARVRVRNLVGRRTERASAADVARATVESVAENTSDAVVGTLVWGAALGPLGVVLHRGANTLDAMWGHRSVRYNRYGWAAARLDDVLGWMPARITLIATALAATGSDDPPSPLVRHALTQGRRHPSPNAGPVEAGFALALGVRLGGRNDYEGGAEDRGHLGHGAPPAPADIPRAAALADQVGWISLGLVLVVRAAARARPRRR